MSPGGGMATQALELHGLRRTFGDVVALDGLSFSVPPGKLFGFIGRNGSGKTTTMRIVCGLLAADAGWVSWQGKPIDGHAPKVRGPALSAYAAAGISSC